MERFPTVLSEELISADFLEKTRKKFHFDVEQAAQIRAAAEKMLPTIREEACCIRQAYAMEKNRSERDFDTTYECVAMSLGKGVDLLQESYSEQGLLLETYIVETLAGELLLRGYDTYNKYVAKHTSLHVARYYFPGSEKSLPLEMLPGLLQNLAPKITCNAAFCMQPKKSVVYIAELTQDETMHCKAICVGCTNKSCPHRIEENKLIRKKLTDLPLTYGYSRIFGIQAKSSGEK